MKEHTYLTSCSLLGDGESLKKYVLKNPQKSIEMNDWFGQISSAFPQMRSTGQLSNQNVTEAVIYSRESNCDENQSVLN